MELRKDHDPAYRFRCGRSGKRSPELSLPDVQCSELAQRCPSANTSLYTAPDRPGNRSDPDGACHGSQLTKSVRPELECWNSGRLDWEHDDSGELYRQ